MNENGTKSRERCELHAKQGIEAWCSREKCIFWRLLDTQDVQISNEQGCGLQHFNTLEDLDPETAAWLLRMKRKLESADPEVEKSRINFKHRE